MNELIYIQLYFIAVSVVMAIHQAGRFDRHLKVTHWLWALIYAAVCFPFGFVNYWLWAVAFFIRIPVFNPLLNVLRHPKKPFWYLGEEGPNRSVLDRIIEPYYKAVYVGCIAAVCVINLILFL